MIRRKTRAQRRADGRFSPKDAAAWRRLIRCARQVSRNPGRFAADLGKAATACRRAVPPPGMGIRDSVFLKLLLAGMGVWSAALAERSMEKLAELDRLADACAAVLDGGDAAGAVDKGSTPYWVEG